MGCGSGGDYYDNDYSYEQYKQDQMAKEAMQEASKSLSKEDFKNIEKLLN